jgi:hypothetical protein
MDKLTQFKNLTCIRELPMRCYSKKFRILHEHLPNIDNEVYYHLECLECNMQFAVKELYDK